MEIKLIIRAPNQNIEDQVINCNSDWTVLKLKCHLCEVYPCKPSIREQKLIYSGHILLDHLQLKDIIRPEDVLSNVHILHLVYSGKYSPPPQEQDSSSQSTSNLPLRTQPDAFPGTSTESSTENILRHRTLSPVPQVNNFPMPVGALPMFYYDPQTLAQMAAMQQMYAQYWQSMNVAASTSNLPVMSNLQVLPAMPNLHVLQNNLNNPAVEAPAPLQANQRANAEAREDNEFANRDWLDNILQYCRFLILLSIVYFYSTPERFMLVILCAVIVLLYREGWFMRQSLEEVILRRRNSVQAEAVVNAANNLNELAPTNQEQVVNEGQELEAAMDGDNPPHAQHLDAVNNNQGFSALSILAAFFFSLVPEPPPPPVNIN